MRRSVRLQPDPFAWVTSRRHYHAFRTGHDDNDDRDACLHVWLQPDATTNVGRSVGLQPDPFAWVTSCRHDARILKRARRHDDRDARLHVWLQPDATTDVGRSVRLQPDPFACAIGKRGHVNLCRAILRAGCGPVAISRQMALIIGRRETLLPF